MGTLDKALEVLDMKEMIINGKKIKTNLGGNYSIGNGNSTKTKDLMIKKSCFESDEEMLKRLVDLGYTSITFKYGTTSVRGYYSTYALVNRLY